MTDTRGNMVRIHPIESSMAVPMSTLVLSGMEPRGNITFIVLDKHNQGMLVYPRSRWCTPDPRSWEVEAGGAHVCVQPGLCSESLSQKGKMNMPCSLKPKYITQEEGHAEPMKGS